jgi:predicted aspartyl protease
VAARKCAFTVSLVLLLAAASARASGPQSRAEIPESIHSDYLMGATTVRLPADPTTLSLEGTDWYGHYRSPYVKVFVNGRGPYTFLFDTGSSVTTISSQVAREASAQIINHVPGHHAIVKLGELRAGDISMRGYYAVIADGDDLDGILGFNAFGKKYLTFDLKQRTLVVGSRPNPLPSAFWMPYRLSHHLPVIELGIDGRRLPTLIDSGDDAYAWEATSSDLHGLTFDRTPVESAIVYNGQTGATRTTITSVDGILEMGNVYADRPAVAINESLPLPDIGVDVMQQFVMEFDRIHQRVGFEPLFNGRKFLVPGERTCGLTISFRRAVRYVRDVLPAMAPARAGVRVGDSIVRVAGKDARGLTFREWDEMLRSRSRIALTWSGRGALQSATFPVVELK